MTTYKIKEIYYTIQGEGHHSGRPALFLRFSGCNLWSGREEDREHATCSFCDTDFWGTDGINGGKYTAEQLVNLCNSLWPQQSPNDLERFIVCTGGEPLLQLDQSLIAELHDHRWYIAIESNGTIAIPDGIDWTCISPKMGSNLIVTSGDELKLVYPQGDVDPAIFLDMTFAHHSLQPMDDEQHNDNIKACVAYCKAHPRWKLSLQSHKMIGIP
jgi:Organic radical activating enzymes